MFRAMDILNYFAVVFHCYWCISLLSPSSTITIPLHTTVILTMTYLSPLNQHRYVLQNNLQFVALSNLPASVYHVLIQMKIITTALLSEIVLHRKHTRTQWLSLFSLFIGVRDEDED